jgi:3-methyl-2-oxobutanoate hydroxymethyltransferase
MGTWSGHKAKFVRRFADLGKEREKGVAGYASAVRGGSFPDADKESYGMDAGEWDRFIV